MKEYYACIKYKDGHIERVRFEARKEAHKYISDNWDEEESVQAWIEKQYSICQNHQWPRRQLVKSSGFHPDMAGA